MFGLGNSVPTNHVHFSFGFSSALDEVSLSPINKVMYLSRKKDILHDMVGDTSRLTFARVVLPVMFKNLTFQPANLVLKLSRMN